MRKKTKFPLIHHQYHLPLILLLIILVTGLITGIYLALTPQDIRQRAQTPVTPPGPTCTDPDKIGDGAILGDPQTAQVAIIEFGDYQCSFCAQFATQTLPQIISQYINTGQAVFAFRNLPLPTHEHAYLLAQAAACAGQQSDTAYYTYHDALLSQSGIDTVDQLKQLAADLNLNTQDFDSCLDSGSAIPLIEADLADASCLNNSGYNLSATPSFLIGALQPDGSLDGFTVINGAAPFSTFQNILNTKLSLANLRQTATQANLQLGTTATSWQALQWPEGREQYSNAVTTHFNHLTSDWDLHWGADATYLFRPDINTFQFDRLDDLLDFAQANNLSFEGHHLLWGNKTSLPDWLKNGSYSQTQLLDIMETHINTVVARYAGRVKTWVVVNEPNGYPDDGGPFWQEQLGPGTDWINQAFHWAHAADPNAELILNDAGIELPNLPNIPDDRYNTTFNLVTNMKQAGVPIDGIGFQMHLNAADFLGGDLATRMQQLTQNIQRYRAAGLDVYITELDIRLDEVVDDYPNENDRLNFQAQIYRQVVTTALENGVKQITFFGLSDEISWYETTLNTPTADATLLDNYTPKPAYYTIIDVITQHLQSPTPIPTPTPSPTSTPTSSPTSTPTPTPTSSPIPGYSCHQTDVNQDGQVNDLDRQLLINHLLSTSHTSTDINNDGITDLTDYSILVNYFGQTCP